ncbi:nodulin homeobox [Rhododendron vialii]|uniref:nodulin homeobox n=1 Tax=Rhododendron vialii TaxID=182163 RepID=UPI00265DA832|nr:nodulin homeobox [Rhododendron vialii]XP_058200230.1 nodulin homeobox [Rhododendron vialii]
MRDTREEPSSSSGHQAVDLISAVKELHNVGSLGLTKLIKDSENNIIQTFTQIGSSSQFDVEKIARCLPLHLIAKVMLSARDEASYKYLLCGIRLVHSLCDLAPRYPKLEQILLDDVKVSEQLLELVFYLLVVLSNHRQEHHASSHMPLLHSALVACSLYLLTGCIASQWQDIASVLVAHRQVYIFMDAAFAALRVDIKFLQFKLSGQCYDFQRESSSNAEGTLNNLCQLCEASLQFLQSLCQQKSFRERLVKNKELCREGGVLLLARSILKLNVTWFRESPSVVAAVFRLKSKVLSILLHLCEAESLSYLDEVASTPRSMDVAKSVALEVLKILKAMVVRGYEICPTGLLQLNAMRLADIFSDDSNFRSYITIYFTEILTAIFSLPHREFLSSWCSSNLPIWEEDATLEYDSFGAAGHVLDLFSSSDLPNVTISRSDFIPSNMPRVAFAHQRTSLLVKVIANLHCYVPGLCKEEEDVFLNKFLECLRRELPKLSASDAEKAGIVSRNLRSLLSHAESLTPPYLNEDDVHLFRVFLMRLEPLITPAEIEVKRVQEAQSAGGCSSPIIEKVDTDTNRLGYLKEGTSENSAFQDEDQSYIRGNCIGQTDDIMWQVKGEDKGKSGMMAEGSREIERCIQKVETSGSDSSSTRGKNCTSQMHNVEFPKSGEHSKQSGFEGLKEDEKGEAVICEQKQQRKRKRTIMNDIQIALIEKALLEEPGMQRNAAWVQSWAEKLSAYGSEVTTSQLKNWLNNRKARLARAAKDVRGPSEEDNGVPDKQGGSGRVSHDESAESPTEDVYITSTPGGTHQSTIRESTSRTGSKEKADIQLADFNNFPAKHCFRWGPGQDVLLLNLEGEEIGTGKVYQVRGTWDSCNLEESEMCVVDVNMIRTESHTGLPIPVGMDAKLGVRTLWALNKLLAA